MEAVKIPHYSMAEYLAFEQDGEQRHEYLNGEIVAMTGASEAHNVIAGNLFAALHGHLRGSPCRVFMSDMKLRVEAANCFFYPDVMVGCTEEPVRGDRYFFDDARLVIEIPSPATESRDREFKRMAYRQLPDLQEYLLVRQDSPGITVYRRLPDGWEMQDYGSGETVRLRSIGLELPVDMIYEGVPTL